jgi:hypothetical protein
MRWKLSGQPGGLEVDRLQVRLAGPCFATYLWRATTIALQNRQYPSSPSRVFASIFQARQAASQPWWMRPRSTDLRTVSMEGVWVGCSIVVVNINVASVE